MNEKNPEIIDNVNLAGTVLHEIEEEQKQARLSQVRDLPKSFSSELDHFKPQDGKVLLTELAKTMFLNAKDPEKYNIEFFARYFNIEPRTLRNVLNTISYPVIEEQTGRIIKMLRFIDL